MFFARNLRVLIFRAGFSMKKSDVIAHFGSVGAVAAALKIAGAAVSQWGENIPVRRAYELERITNGALKVDSASEQTKAA